uniref:Ricin B lectin domain-containing protein n=1 Tax=Kwoniella pini CBS 10737 TaxID=1296096 RepID=A0A1B9I9M1_9TREE|nr:uncharacterized protein I206_01449 [Kwoniella pini CBS 10737]OCF52164.1 hypothetical protein I206_01449 [Kwoniella pini CBS 10737]
MFSTLSSFIFFLVTSSSFDLVASAPTSLTSRRDQTDTTWARGYYIVPVAAGDKCLAASQPNPTAGTQVITTNCQNASKWSIPLVESGGAVVHDDSGLVLDLGNGNNKDKLTLRNFTGDDQSQFFRHGSDNRLSNNATNKCLDEGEDGPQVYDCYPQNTNQVWLIRQTPDAKNISEGIPVGSEVSTPNSNLQYIHPKDRGDVCVSAISSGPAAQDQAGVAFTYCAGTGFSNSGTNTSQDLMQWSLPTTDPDQVRLGSSGLCLETGANIVNSYGYEELKVADGMAVKVATCVDNSEGQKWTWDGQLLKSAIKSLDQSDQAGQCLNFAAVAGYVKMDNFLNLRPLQTWGCSTQNENELFRAY